MVVIDATTLMLLLRPDAGVPVGPDNMPIGKPQERLAHLVERLDKARVKIIIPAPALSEVLVRVDPLEAQRLVERISTMSIFRVEAFDERAALEVALMTRNSVDGGMKPGRRDPKATWAKLKYDRQIVAIAAVTQCTAIYSDDRDVRAIAKRSNIPVIGLADLELPLSSSQMDMFVADEDPAAHQGD